MSAQLRFFPVGNGDMTLVTLESGRKILVDCNIRAAADDPDDDTPDVATELWDQLTRDDKGRLFVDAFLLSHPDEDHCRGLKRHFHLGKPADWSKSADKIFVREMWSSPMVFRRASKNHVLSEDALAWKAEARRRVAAYRASPGGITDGDRILILGEDEDGKTDDLQAILVRVDQEFMRVNGNYDATMKARLLAPHPKGDEDEEEERSKNHSSVVINFSLTGGGVAGACRFLTGGDAEVLIWERMWARHSHHPDWLAYDVLQTPHHCSWHSLSYDSWSEKGEDAEVCEDARKALGQARDGAVIVASSVAIKDDDKDPPCIRAKREYQDIADGAGGSFKCVGEPESDPKSLVFEIGANGFRAVAKVLRPAVIVGSGAVGRQALAHGSQPLAHG
jgi:hypothetical protein